MHALATPDKVDLFHHEPNQAESFELAITAHECSARGIDCLYSSMCHDPTHRATSKSEEVSKNDSPSFSFLLHASNPAQPSMDAIVAREPERTSEMPAWKQRETVGWSSGTVDPSFLLFNLPDMLLDEPQDYENTENDMLQFSGIFGPSDDSADALSMQIVALSNILQGLTTNKPHLRDGFDQSCQRGFFTTSHFQNVLVFVFRRRHYHQDTIHWPTFDPDKISPHLLLAVVLTGTVYLQCLNQSSPSSINTSLLELAENEAVAGLLAEDWTPATRDSFGELDHSDLFYLTSGIGRYVFHHRTWDSLWVDAYERIPRDERQWLGIKKHTAEVMALSRRTIEIIESGEAKDSAYLQDVGTYDTAVFHDFVQKFGQTSFVTGKN
ncbi:hypothetical protein FMEXI_7356 [Fusarium mexicanum]|uniref:Transcription factor domain-containing protein n=1 Tax=Fusarium mexicanum TaxID=751941 RepID=A0A8H5ISV6_9HYPO|nr:hypothetical protein FMEXI_7356 [Fusarium mexicanum]